MLLEKIDRYDLKVFNACREAMILGETVDGFHGTYVDFPDTAAEFLGFYVRYLEETGIFRNIAMKDKKLTLKWLGNF
jgi:ATP-dependent RNA circularization protein (DNA/RNA ligase family)